MSNTLETKTPEQLTHALQSYNSYLCDIPDSFTVLDEYLNGLSQSEFCEAFKELQVIVSDIYKYLQENPQSIGLIKANKKNGELEVQTSQHISCVKKLIYTIGYFSNLNLDSKSLFIRMDSLMNAYMTYYSNCSVELSEIVNVYDTTKQSKFLETKHMWNVFGVIEQFGFLIEGLKQEAYNEEAILEISYPKRPFVINVLKAFSMPRICRISFGFDYTKFNYHVFAYTSKAKLPLTDLYSFQLLSDEHKKFLIRLNQTMEEETGAGYGECESGWYNGTLPCQYIYRNKVRVLQNIENGLIPAVVITSGMKPEKITKKTGKYISYFESLPDEYKSIMKCRGCRKGECGKIAITIEDKKYVMCVGKGAWWMFPPKEEAIKFIVAAYKI